MSEPDITLLIQIDLNHKAFQLADDLSNPAASAVLIPVKALAAVKWLQLATLPRPTIERQDIHLADGSVVGAFAIMVTDPEEVPDETTNP